VEYEPALFYKHVPSTLLVMRFNQFFTRFLKSQLAIVNGLWRLRAHTNA